MKKLFLYFFALFSSLIMFHKPLETLISNTLVRCAFKYVESEWYNDLILITTASFFLVYILYNINKHTISIYLFVTLLSFDFFYLFHRIYWNEWNFTSFTFAPAINYLDIIFFVTACELLLLINKSDISFNSNSDAFFDDEPLGENKKDELGYGEYAKMISKKILGSKFDKAFAIGINGKWGLGKTSFIDLIKRNTNRSEIIEINFNPWKSSSPESIVQDFFDTLQEETSKFHSSISKQITLYSNKLVSLKDNDYTQAIRTSLYTLSGLKSSNSLFDDINITLNRINKKIIIYIDDLDRLDPKEIIEVIRLIRNTANFNNVFFIVTYDRNYIVNALKKHNSFKQERFLDKIFQLEVTLPFFKTDIFRKKLYENLTSRFPDYDKEIKDAIIGTASNSPLSLNEWLESMRDITRLSNSLILNLEKLLGEVDFSDFLKLEILRTKYPAAYEIIFRQADIVLELYDPTALSHQKQYKLRMVNGQMTMFEKVLRSKEINLSVSDIEINKLISFVNDIFPSGIIYGEVSILSVIYPSKFERYFAYNLLDDSLSEIEFSKARASEQLDFNNSINKWLANGLESEIRNKFQNINNYDNKEDFERIIQGIFYFANQKKNDRYGKQSLIGYDAKNLMRKLDINANNIIDKYYINNGGELDYKLFLITLFKVAKYPYLFEAQTISYFINEQFDDNFILKKRELSELRLNYLIEYGSISTIISPEMWDLFYSCYEIQRVPTGNNNTYKRIRIVPHKTQIIMQGFILKDLDNFLYKIINLDFEPKKYSINSFVIDIYGSWKDFEEKILKQSTLEWNYLHEFKALFEAFKSTGYTDWVIFNFKDIPINRKRKEL